MLPRDIARCEGQDWPEFGVMPQCIDCLRRTSRPAGILPFMDPPEGEPCPMRIAPEGE